VEIGELQQRVTVELRCQSPDADLDVLQRWHPQRLVDTYRSEDGGDGAQPVAYTVGHANAAAMDKHCDQRPDIEQQLHRREQDDRSERPIEENDHGARKLGREGRPR
jgi:hypothetical protein